MMNMQFICSKLALITTTRKCVTSLKLKKYVSLPNYRIVNGRLTVSSWFVTTKTYEADMALQY